MKLQTLKEAKYAFRKTLEQVMSYVDEDETIRDGFVVKLKRQTTVVEPIFAVSVQHDEEDGSPYVIVSFYDRDDSEVYHPDEFVENVEVYATKRIL